MPEGWKEAAKTTKALERGRNIRTPEELLRLNLLYQTNGGSYGLTAALLQLSEDSLNLNKNAVYKRITHSGEWLKWLCEHLSRQEGFLVKPPEWLKNYRVCMTDASDYSKPGSKQSDMRFHYMTELFTLNMVEMYFTDASEGEKITRYTKIQPDDIILADRIYGTPTGMQYMKEHKAFFVFRIRAEAFTLYQENGEKFDLTKRLKEWKSGEIINLSLFFKKNKEMIPVRICAKGKTQEEIEKSQHRLKKLNSKKQRGKITELQEIYSKYIVTATSLPDSISAEQVLELYRMRWQIELVFKRFKSIFNAGEFAPKKENSIRAWFYGKLLLAMICETFAKKGRFSPDGQAICSENSIISLE